MGGGGGHWAAQGADARCPRGAPSSSPPALAPPPPGKRDEALARLGADDFVVSGRPFRLAGFAHLFLFYFFWGGGVSFLPLPLRRRALLSRVPAGHQAKAAAAGASASACAPPLPSPPRARARPSPPPQHTHGCRCPETLTRWPGWPAPCMASSTLCQVGWCGVVCVWGGGGAPAWCHAPPCPLPKTHTHAHTPTPTHTQPTMTWPHTSPCCASTVGWGGAWWGSGGGCGCLFCFFGGGAHAAGAPTHPTAALHLLAKNPFLRPPRQAGAGGPAARRHGHQGDTADVA